MWGADMLPTRASESGPGPSRPMVIPEGAPLKDGVVGSAPSATSNPSSWGDTATLHQRSSLRSVARAARPLTSNPGSLRPFADLDLDPSITQIDGTPLPIWSWESWWPRLAYHRSMPPPPPPTSIQQVLSSPSPASRVPAPLFGPGPVSLHHPGRCYASRDVGLMAHDEDGLLVSKAAPPPPSPSPAGAFAPFASQPLHSIAVLDIGCTPSVRCWASHWVWQCTIPPPPPSPSHYPTKPPSSGINQGSCL